MEQLRLFDVGPFIKSAGRSSGARDISGMARKMFTRKRAMYMGGAVAGGLYMAHRSSARNGLGSQNGYPTGMYGR